MAVEWQRGCSLYICTDVAVMDFADTKFYQKSFHYFEASGAYLKTHTNFLLQDMYVIYDNADKNRMLCLFVYKSYFTVT